MQKIFSIYKICRNATVNIRIQIQVPIVFNFLIAAKKKSILLKTNLR